MGGGGGEVFDFCRGGHGFFRQSSFKGSMEVPEGVYRGLGISAPGCRIGCGSLPRISR